MNRWAGRETGTAAGAFLGAVRSEIPVALIATPRADLKCQREDRWQEIASDPELSDFDQVPVTDGESGHIVAVFIRGSGLITLRESMLMSADAPLIAFLESADNQRFRLLVEDRKLSGMVTLSDVQKLPVYSVIFSLLIIVEMLLMDWIRKSCADHTDKWLDHLDNNQRTTIERHWKNAVKNNVAIDRLSCASFGHEIRAAAGLGLFESHTDRHKTLVALEGLRHKVCHAIEFAPTADQALTIPSHVRDAQGIAIWLRSQIAEWSV